MKALNTISLSLLSALSLGSYAELKPMDDASMEETVGQAYIVMDSYVDVDSNQISKVTFGQTVKIQTNIDAVTLGGNYDNGLGGPVGTDLGATNMSFGHINSAGEIVPFVFENPYIEWATDASNNIVGFRVGAENTKGIMQADWSSFSGHIGMTIDGQPAQLHSGAGAGTNTNNRGTHIGSNATDCNVGSDCLALTDILSLSVGDSASGNDSNDVPVTGTADFFLSFQRNTMNWNLSSGTRNASKGFFMNIPTNNSITTAGGGTPGYTVEFIDRGIGRWH